VTRHEVVLVPFPFDDLSTGGIATSSGGAVIQFLEMKLGIALICTVGLRQIVGQAVDELVRVLSALP